MKSKITNVVRRDFVKHRPDLAPIAILLKGMLSGRLFETKVTRITVLVQEKLHKPCMATPPRLH